MGLWMSKFFSVFDVFKNDPAKVILLGLDMAGKTTVLYKVKLNECVTTIPTIGFNVEQVQPCKGLEMTVWDVGGQDVLRPLWRHYYQDADCLIYIVDSQDKERLPLAKKELWGIMQADAFPLHCPVVILANKQDLPHAVSTSDLTGHLDMRNIHGRDWFIQPTCATTGDGIFEAFSKASQLIKKYKSSSN